MSSSLLLSSNNRILFKGEAGPIPFSTLDRNACSSGVCFDTKSVRMSSQDEETMDLRLVSNSAKFELFTLPPEIDDDREEAISPIRVWKGLPGRFSAASLLVRYLEVGKEDLDESAEGKASTGLLLWKLKARSPVRTTDEESIANFLVVPLFIVLPAGVSMLVAVSSQS